MSSKSLSDKRREAGRKGGKAKGRKGLRALPPEKVREIARSGGKAKWSNHKSSKYGGSK